MRKEKCMTAIWAWVKGLFTAKKVGVLLAIFAKKAVVPVIAEIADPENQKKAYGFVKELRLRTDLTNEQKAALFNKQMLEWSKKAGKILADSVVNCLRELAVNALKAEMGRDWHGSAQVSCE